jgi:hypothetical protein
MGGNIFPFEFPFSDARYFERAFRELGEVARETPFLLLNSGVAREIFEEIKKTCSEISLSLPYERLYRGRCKEKPTVDDFDAPPASKVQEGRYNHAGRPVLYLASDRRTCWEECRRPTDNFYTLEFSVDSGLPDVLYQ